MVRTRSSAAPAGADGAPAESEAARGAPVTSSSLSGSSGLSMRSLSKRWPFGRNSSDSVSSAGTRRDGSPNASDGQSSPAGSDQAPDGEAPSQGRRRWGMTRRSGSRASRDRTSGSQSPHGFEIGERIDRTLTHRHMSTAQP